jgi:hypothetical protein
MTRLSVTSAKKSEVDTKKNGIKAAKKTIPVATKKATVKKKAETKAKNSVPKKKTKAENNDKKKIVEKVEKNISLSSPQKSSYLASLGLTPALSPTNPPTYGNSFKNWLFMCVVAGPDITSIAVRIQVGDQKNSWPDKCFADFVGVPSKTGPGRQPWADELNFDRFVFFWYHDNKRQVFANTGYSKRMFVMRVAGQTKINEKTLLQIGKDICLNFNSSPDMARKDYIDIDPKHFIWIQNPVWSDILGFQGAADELIRVAGMPDDESFYKKNKKLIRSFFHPKTMPGSIVKMLRAPESELGSNSGPNYSYAPGFNIPNGDHFEVTGSKAKEESEEEDNSDHDDDENNDDDYESEEDV